MHFRKRGMHSSSNFARDTVRLKSSPSASVSQKISDVWAADRIRLAFSHCSQPSHGSCIVPDVLAGLRLERSEAVVDQNVVEVLSTQVGVAVGGPDLEDAVINRQQGDVEGTTSQVEDEYIGLSLVLLVQPVGDGSRSRLVDDSLHREASDGTCVLGCLPL